MTLHQLSNQEINKYHSVKKFRSLDENKIMILAQP